MSATKSSEQADRPRTIRPKLSHSHTVDVVMLPPLLRALQHVVGSIADGDLLLDQQTGVPKDRPVETANGSLMAPRHKRATLGTSGSLYRTAKRSPAVVT